MSAPEKLIFGCRIQTRYGNPSDMENQFKSEGRFDTTDAIFISGFKFNCFRRVLLGIDGAHRGAKLLQMVYFTDSCGISLIHQLQQDYVAFQRVLLEISHLS